MPGQEGIVSFEVDEVVVVQPFTLRIGHTTRDLRQLGSWVNRQGWETGTAPIGPSLHMRVVAFSQDTDEYGAVVSWSLQLEEV